MKHRFFFYVGDGVIHSIMSSENLLPWALQVNSCLCSLLILSLILNFEGNFVIVQIILHVCFAGMTDFKVFHKDLCVFSPTLLFYGNISKYSIFSIVSCYLSWLWHLVYIFQWFNSLFYYPIWITIDVSKHFLKVFQFILQMLVVKAHFEGFSSYCL